MFSTQQIIIGICVLVGVVLAILFPVAMGIIGALGVVGLAAYMRFSKYSDGHMYNYGPVFLWLYFAGLLAVSLVVLAALYIFGA